jgi:putative restriction endonuclease
MDSDLSIRLAAFQWLAEQTRIHGEDVLSRDQLQQGFQYNGERVPLMGPQGIFKPRLMELPLTITTTVGGPYQDSFEDGEMLYYRYRGKDPQHRDNVGLRRVMQEKKPLIYFFGLIPSEYLAVWPVYIVGDNPAALSFQVVTDEISKVKEQPAHLEHTISEDARRQYLTAMVRVRLHQRSFRERVLQAYKSQCALCRLRHRELLDAAHIYPDPDPQGWPLVKNGLALCKLHHAAFDTYLLTVTPDYIIRIRDDILNEKDGPVLQHALKGLENTHILLPHDQKNWPDREALEWRYAKFQHKS